MKVSTIFFSLATAALFAACATKTTPLTMQGVVIDATMNNIFIKTAAGDSVNLSTMDANPADVPGVLIDDSISVVYKDTANMKLVTQLTVLRHSPYFFIQGRWVEANPINKAQVQGFAINADGTVSSINMATLQYNNWNFDIEKHTLTLGGQSIGNGTTINFADTMNIVKLDADSLLLASDGAVIYRLARQK
ncbi:MAG: lipocalin family protein [Mucinivorans sp.]